MENYNWTKMCDLLLLCQTDVHKCPKLDLSQIHFIHST